MKWLRYLLIIIFAVVFLLLGLLNTETVTFNYLLSSIQLPMLVVILVSFVFGALLMMLIFGFKAMVWRGRARKLQSKIEKQEAQLSEQAVKTHFEKESATAK